MGYKSSGRSRIEPLQPVCRKKAYNTEGEAEAMISHIRETRVTREIRAYKCSVCGLWHLTSKARED